MSAQDRCCSIVPYFKIHHDQLGAFKQLCERLVEKTSSEPKFLYYGFCFNDNLAHCREGYADATGVLSHLENVSSLLEEALQISDLVRLEIHGPEAELHKLRSP
uniref:ABM domain-containing protein n=1 Tax=Cyanothece sp. (strain PCC 7425 / ATCC 29141) TaxID=395961 RepID=B8HVT6_CYAP4